MLTAQSAVNRGEVTCVCVAMMAWISEQQPPSNLAFYHNNVMQFSPAGLQTVSQTSGGNKDKTLPYLYLIT